METTVIPILPDDAALALACGLHPRLGIDSPVVPCLGKPFLSRLCEREESILACHGLTDRLTL